MQVIDQIELGTGLAQRGQRGGDLPPVVGAVVEHMGQRGRERQRRRRAAHGGVVQRAIPARRCEACDQWCPARCAFAQALSLIHI